MAQDEHIPPKTRAAASQQAPELPQQLLARRRALLEKIVAEDAPLLKRLGR